MVTFLVAFSFECFSATSRAAIFSTAAGWIAIALLVLWTVITGWESGETSMWARTKQRLRAVFSREDENEDGDGSAALGSSASAVTSEKERLDQRWWARIRMLTPHSFSHSGDPPMAEMGRVSSRV